MFLRPSLNPKSSILNPESGFTLVEILVLVGVTMMLSGFLITFNSTGRQQITLYVEETKLAQMILQSKSLTLSTYNRSGNGGLVVCGYGVHIAYGAAPTYNLFSYTAPGGKLSNCENLASFDRTSENTLEDYRFALTSGVLFDESSSTLTDVLFVPPDPKTYIVDASGAISNVAGTISLEAQNGSAHLNIVVNTAGQISF